MDESSAASSKATVPAKKPVRPQPKGLKMRFLPIGFGTGNPGKIGSDSNSVDGSSTGSVSDSDNEEGASKGFKKPASIASSSDEESDQEMTEAPPLPKPKVSKAPSSSTPLKRKHSEGGGEKKSKHSSSKPAPHIDDRQLKRQKTKQNGSQEDKALASTKTVTPIPPPKSLLKTSDTPKSILKKPTQGPASSPPRPSESTHSNLPPPSASAPPVSNGSEAKVKKSKHKHRDRDSKFPTAPGKELSIKELTKATDPSLTSEEWRKKMKKLKREESSQESQEKRK